ncbi:hypothetical protein Q765_05920 [Flavobacterium rivuli WB 3.3-2 = DSM 21788]|uniref:Uncharacterized protein n=1 Tax=Flavobacterium rivuli WB 3.3-2 = DSM 21788 TaxID=1121895 RepID=A0A0A2M6J0_9FLAO|nr:hypothetical protein [Flavobacterium rivuli]KGO87206.1 hypothetical protein Q765_05920 [Flavobacterium rivuli WB 3.3-2 = DSM 21788]
MEAIKLREKLIQEINVADDQLLKVVEDVIENYNHIQYNIVSEPMTIEQYNNEIEFADNDIASGNVFTHDEVSEIVKRWRRG